MPDPTAPHTPWRKSTHSGNGANCVEIAVTHAHKPEAHPLYLIRDSKTPATPPLTFTHPEWKTFITTLKTSKSTTALDPT